MNTRTPTPPERVVKWMRNWLATSGSPPQVHWEVLAGDGSPRVFYRVLLAHRRVVLLSDPDWILSKDYAAHQEYLAKLGVPVPQFFLVDPKAGFLLMEDLGDELLQHRILKDPGSRFSWMEQALSLLADLHGKTFPVPASLPVASRQFDTQKYFEELLFTETHLNEHLLGLKTITAERKTKLHAFCESLSKVSPQVFAHRDYHTRNLLVSEEKLRLIDFQDARMGSPHYDVASFVLDPYVPTTEAERVKLCALYRQKLESYPVAGQVDWTDFDRCLGRTGVQRMVKAAGSFASFYNRYGKKTHLPYLVPALKTAQALLSQYGDKMEQDAFPLTQWMEQAVKISGTLKGQ